MQEIKQEVYQAPNEQGRHTCLLCCYYFQTCFLLLLFLMQFSIHLSKIQFKHPALWKSFLDLVLAVSFNQLRNYHAGGRGKGSRPQWCIESHPFCSCTDSNVEKNAYGLKMRFPAVVNAMNEEYWDFEKHIGHQNQLLRSGKSAWCPGRGNQPGTDCALCQNSLQCVQFMLVQSRCDTRTRLYQHLYLLPQKTTKVQMLGG